MKIRGHRIELREIEEVLRSGQEISDAVAVVVADAMEAPLCRALKELTDEEAENILNRIEAS